MVDKNKKPVNILTKPEKKISHSSEIEAMIKWEEYKRDHFASTKKEKDECISRINDLRNEGKSSKVSKNAAKLS